jgi:Cof subfamily protein (haloacid dehalogenase superfamily)
MSIKILFTDLDGTLVQHAGDVTQQTVEVAKKLIARGIDIVIVTGRHPDLTKSIHSRMGLKTPVIGCNGGVIKDISSNKNLFENRLPTSIIKQAIEISRELGVAWVVYEKDKIFYKEKLPKSYTLPYNNIQLPQNLRANFIKIDTFEEMYQEDNVFLKILLLFDDKLEVIDYGYKLLSKIPNIEILRSAHTYIDVMANGSSKGKAVKRYLNMVNIKKENIAAIGDAENDIDMVEFAGIGFAMGNAIQRLKDVAQYTTRNFPKGFEDAVEYLLDPNKVDIIFR